jgi:hypothetical protein
MIGSRRAAAGVLAAFTLAGCGSNGGGAAGGTASPTSAEDAQVKFAQCMRQHGVNVPDPKPGGRGGVFISGKKGDEGKINAAMSACRKFAPKGNLDPNDPRVRDQMLKTAQCLRRHGVNVADPQPGQGLNIKIRGDQAKMRQAMEACRKEVPPPNQSNGG